MDQDTNVSQSGHSFDEHSPVRTLKRIDPLKWPNERLKWIWDQLLTQDYALDDPARALGAQAFLGQLFDVSNEFYEYGDDGIAVAANIIPKVNALIHFVNWGEVDPREIYAVQRTWFADLFNRWQLMRLTAYIPAFNRPAIRLATICGFKYEGELRKAFLRNGVYHGLTVYGILKDEFRRREEVRA